MKMNVLIDSDGLSKHYGKVSHEMMMIGMFAVGERITGIAGISWMLGAGLVNPQGMIGKTHGRVIE